MLKLIDELYDQAAYPLALAIGLAVLGAILYMITDGMNPRSWPARMLITFFRIVFIFIALIGAYGIIVIVVTSN